MDCDKILNDYIEPNIITALKGVLTFGIYNQEIALHNIRVNNTYRKCLSENN